MSLVTDGNPGDNGLITITNREFRFTGISAERESRLQLDSENEPLKQDFEFQVKDMKFLIISIVGLLTILGAFPAAFATHSTPFNGMGSGTFTDTSPTTVLITGTGHYDHLGLTTLRFPSTITGPATCGGFTATEQDTYTAANGDSVFQTVHDTICPTTTPNAFTLTGSFTVTGGTGRFADASGSGTVQASITFTSATTGTFSGTQTGTISY